ncbi:MAG TPA: helix-turn-helix domain-containing protein [Mucilaginibacter sp.]|jgi:AraC family transcriptional activator of pobA
MKNTILNYGLYGDIDKIPLPGFVHCEPLDTRSRRYNWVIKQHLHTGLFQVFLYAEGTGVVFSESNKFTLKAPCLLIIPENTLHGFEQQPDVRGTVITLSSAYLEQLFPNTSPVIPALATIQSFHKSDNIDLFEKVLHTIEAVEDELFGSFAQRDVMLQSLFTTLFTNIFRLSNLQHVQSLSDDNRSLEIFKVFLKSIRKSTSPHKPINDYAAEQNITPVHLNRVCRSVAKKTATEIVQGHYISEAKKYFSHTSLNIAEVAYKLSFEDPAYFSRYFKKKEGISPKAFLRNLDQRKKVSTTKSLGETKFS